MDTQQKRIEDFFVWIKTMMEKHIITLKRYVEVTDVDRDYWEKKIMFWEGELKKL